MLQEAAPRRENSTGAMVDLTPAFRSAFPEGIFGCLIVRACANKPRVEAAAGEVRAVEERLRARFPGEAIDADPVAQAYAAYFRRHGARYPVVHQGRTILSGRSIESPSALVGLMFAAEVESLVLTSGHDLDALRGALLVDVPRDGEGYMRLNGKDQRLRPGDMVVRDDEGVIAAVIHGPDYRTRITLETSSALFGAWCPAGVDESAVEGHLGALARLVRLEWPDARIDPPLLLAAARAEPRTLDTLRS